MNGVHDMGGMQDMGPIQHEKNEPVFHARWEARVRVLAQALAAWGKWNLDADRYENELIPPVDYLRYSYYERWFAVLVALSVKHGLITSAEVKSGTPATGSSKATPALTTSGVVSALTTGVVSSRNVPVAPRFQVSQRVRSRNLNPTGHTRLPRYALGKLGTIERDYGVFVFPDTNAEFLGEKPQHVYSVRFAARELWGEQARPQDSVYLDLWDDYLEPA
jgi:nitrile hydratase beta subunit